MKNNGITGDGNNNSCCRVCKPLCLACGNQKIRPNDLVCRVCGHKLRGESYE